MYNTEKVKKNILCSKSSLKLYNSVNHDTWKSLHLLVKEDRLVLSSGSIRNFKFGNFSVLCKHLRLNSNNTFVGGLNLVTVNTKVNHKVKNKS